MELTAASVWVFESLWASLVPLLSGRRPLVSVTQDPEIGLPALELEERFMIQAQPNGQTLARDRLIEHPAQSHSVHRHLWAANL